MGPCSIALYNCLTSDLGHVLHSLPLGRLERNVREALWPGCTTRAVASAFLLDSIFKKFEDGKSDHADTNALTKFLACNLHCEGFRSISTTNMTEIQAICLGEFKKSFHDFFLAPGGDYILNPENISQGINVGPGASVGVTGTSFYHKVAAGPLTGTNPSLYSLYKREASKYPLWDETEKIRFNHFGGFKKVIGSRLSFVPKSIDVSRTICTEPLLNMLFQKGIGARLESQLSSRFGIDLTIQPDKNRILAKVGSETGDFGTIDLSSASDTISMNLLREILPSYVFSWLKETRSENVLLPSGELLNLHMVSSMGNAFTFPLQTILFSSVVIGVYKALDLEIIYPRGKTLGNWAVFGDDIIVHRKAYNLVVDLLNRLGFFVNHDKSFNEGPFRESCGSDYWNGHNVRGVYCRSLKTKQDVYSLVNRLNVWSANNSIALPSTVQYLIDSSRLKFCPVPPWESDVAGLKVPWELVKPLKMRRQKGTGSVVYSRYLAQPISTSLLSIGDRIKMRHLGRDLIHNPAGILFSAIGGYLRKGNLLSNRQITQYQKRFAIAPCWDYIDPYNSTLTSCGWHNWKSGYVYMNIVNSYSVILML